jgi:hypothetical protein
VCSGCSVEAAGAVEARRFAKKSKSVALKHTRACVRSHRWSEAVEYNTAAHTVAVQIAAATEIRQALGRGMGPDSA